MKKNALYWAAFAAFVLGLVLGFVTPGLFAPISFLGDIYLNLLKLIVIPYIIIFYKWIILRHIMSPWFKRFFSRIK